MVESKNIDAQRWRDRYFTLSEEQEKSEQAYAADLKVLQRALVRISLAADGQDKDLDKQLGTLRNMLRKDPVDQKGVSNHLGLIETALLRLDKERSSAGGQGLGALQQLVEQLSNLNLSRDKQKALKHYAKILKAQGDQLGAYPALLEEYGRLQKTALAEVLQSAGQPAAQGAETGKGFMARLFGAKEVADGATGVDVPVVAEATKPEKESAERGRSEADEDTQAMSEPAGEALVEPPAQVPPEEPADNDNKGAPAEDIGQSGDIESVVKALVELLEQLPLPQEERGVAEELRDQLCETEAVDELSHLVDGAAELVLEALGNSQQDFEQFLLGLDEQLADINAYLDRQRQGVAGEQSAGRQLDSRIREQVGGINRAVDEASDLNELKASVQTQLQSISGAMDDFVSTETQREQALAQELEVMREKLEVMQSEAQAIRKKLHNETLRALTDTLTHIPNREAFDERYSLERERFLRYKQPACIAILDIDHFKQVNDKHGHLVGDRVLQEVARTIKKVIRKTDFAARYGGEEFVLILPETTLEKAEVALNKVREAVMMMPIKALGADEKITLSAGFAAFQLGELAEVLIERADKALYQAKAHGRNRVEAAG